jgi:hypothetical protein
MEGHEGDRQEAWKDDFKVKVKAKDKNNKNAHSSKRVDDKVINLEELTK